MPRPPFLPVLDWSAIHGSGLSWSAWLAKAEFPDKRDAMAQAADQLVPPPDVMALLAGLKKSVPVVAIAEDWCGDVVRHAPVLEAISRVQPLVQVRYIARHDGPDVFVRFLTNGGEAIPKFVFLSESFVECGNWGPMQADCREWISRGKACGDVAAARRRVSAIYEADSGREQAFRELAALAALAATPALEG